uniref:LITAF domain-containing protein n=1 Tax=Ditylenchus dipsaci TaxID=166011 RepID=A0A915D9V4_9BILA
MDGAPPPYEDNSKPSMYPTTNDGAPQYHQQAPYQPNLTNPYPPHYSAPPTAAQHHHHQPGAGVQQPTQHVYVNNTQYGPNPVTVTCPHCHQNTVSKLKFSAGLLAWILFGLLLLFGCWMVVV